MNAIFVAQAAAMYRALQTAGAATHRRNTIPILGHILIKGEVGGSLTLSGTDLDMVSSARVDGEVEDAFAITVGKPFLANFLRYAQGLVTGTIADGMLTLEDGDAIKATVRLLSPIEDWPTSLPDARIAGGDGTTTSIMSEAVLQKVLTNVAPCISTEQARYYLNGTYLHPIDGKLCAVATDGHRLARYQTAEAWEHLPGILPTATVKILRTWLRPGGNREVRVRSCERAMQFGTEDWTLSTKLIDGTFPDYLRVIPGENKAPWTEQIAVTLTAAALRRLPISSEHACAIDPDGGTMTIRNVNEDATYTAPCTGHGAKFGANIRYLRAFADLAGTIRLAGHTGRDPFLVQTEDPALTQVLMPMRV